MDLPHNSHLTRIDFTFSDNCTTCGFKLGIAKVAISNPDPNEFLVNGNDVTKIAEFESTYDFVEDVTTEHMVLDEIIDNENFYYLVVILNTATPLMPKIRFYNSKLTYNY